MERARLLELVIQLGGEFSRRGMTKHCRLLRLYHLALQHGLDADARYGVDVQWDKKTLVEWLSLLRIPPYQNTYPVRNDTACVRCEDRPGTVVPKAAFPGGSKLECLQCGRVWLMLDVSEK